MVYLSDDQWLIHFPCWESRAMHEAGWQDASEAMSCGWGFLEASESMWCGNAALKGVYAEGGVQGYGE